MKTVLFVTVGGSPQPIVTAINSLQPDRVIFVCSTGSNGSLSQVTGSGTPCEIRKGSEVVDKLPNIPTQANLGERFDPEQDVVALEDPDDFDECYRQIKLKMAQIRQQDPTVQIKADYTGGTKTMSVTLAIAALDVDAQVFITTGNRQDLIKVKRGEATEQANIAPVVVQRVIEYDLPPLLNQYNYPAALVQLKQLLVDHQLTPENRKRVRHHQDLCLAFDAWDRFDHLTAWDYLQPFMREKLIQPLGLFLKRVIDSRGRIDSDFDGSQGTPGHGYEILQDLLLNAERRAHQHRYDDAVGRIYRALELLAQLRLKLQYGIDTGNVDPNKLPEAIRDRYPRDEEGKIKLALSDSYGLLKHWQEDPLGQLYQSRKSLIDDALQIRNYSLFAHGFKPISQSDYQKMQGSLIVFIQDGLQLLTSGKRNVPQAPQFPHHFLFDQP